MIKKDEKLLESLSAGRMFRGRASLHAAAIESKRKYDAEITSWDVSKNPRRIPFIKAGTDALLFLERIAKEMLGVAVMEAHRNGDMSALHDALFTVSRMELPLIRYYSDGAEYVRVWDMLNALAACDIGAFRRAFAPDCPLLTKGYRLCFIGYNLILGLIYHDGNRLAAGIRQAETGLTRKNPLFDAAALSYLLALARQDGAEANRFFSEMMKSYRRFVGEFDDPFWKVFALRPHGFYNLAYYALPPEQFARIKPPKDTAFWPELAEYQKQAGYIRGKPFIPFDGPLAALGEMIFQG
ncbi:MAG: hypothetical protein LBP78_07355 [Acidaminococcales bacterium]|jgi:hypothetical protein|nr:hypothetical protein [Acidaminococcales bacterium]